MEQTTASASTAGLTNFILFGTAVLSQIVAPKLLIKLGSTTVLLLASAGLAIPPLSLMGVEALQLSSSDYSALVLAASAIRGLSFGLCTVATSTLYIGNGENRGVQRSAARFGLITGIASLAFIPAGVFIASNWSATSLYLCAAIAAAVALLATMRRRRASTDDIKTPMRPQAWTVFIRHQSRLIVAIATVSSAWIVMITFLPARLEDPIFATVALLLANVLRLVGRTVSGWFPQTQVATILLPFGMMILGFFALTMPNLEFVIGGLLLLGFANGVFATGVMVAMLRGGATRPRADSLMLWNVAIDVGGSLGAVIFSSSLALVGTELSWLFVPCALILSLSYFVWKRPDRLPRDVPTE